MISWITNFFSDVRISPDPEPVKATSVRVTREERDKDKYEVSLCSQGDSSYYIAKYMTVSGYKNVKMATRFGTAILQDPIWSSFYFTLTRLTVVESDALRFKSLKEAEDRIDKHRTKANFERVITKEVWKY